MKKRILFITSMDGAPWGGSEELWYRAALLLQQQGFETAASVMKFDTVAPHIAQLIQAGTRIFYRSHLTSFHVPAYKRIATRLLPARYSINLHEQWHKVLDQFKPDLVLITLGDQNEGLHWMQACMQRNIQYCINVQLVKEGTLLYDGTFEKMRHAFNVARRVFFLSLANQRIMEQELATNLVKALQIRNPINVKYQDIQQFPPTEVFKLAVVGSLNATHKGHDLLFDVLAQEKWRQRNIEISIFGKGSQETYIKALQQYYKLHNVFFRGFVDGVEKIWQTHHALLMTARMEGAPMTIVEAMLCKRLVIATPVGIAPEVIDDNVTGFLALAATAPLLDEAMERAWQQRANWQQIGETAYQRIRTFVPDNPIQVFADTLISQLVS